MPDATQPADDVLGASVEGEGENIVDESILDDMPDDGTFGETEEKPQDAPEEGAEETETPVEGEGTQPKEGAEETVETWKARAEKNERLARLNQSRYDQLSGQLQPYASRLAEMIRADQEKAEKMQKDNDYMLREFATDANGVIRTLVSQELSTIRTQAQAMQIQAEFHRADQELRGYASERGIDDNRLSVLMAPYGGFANVAPQQALAMAKVVVDQAVAPQTNQANVEAALKAADAQTKQKLVKKSPVGQPGGSLQGREPSEADKKWEAIKNSGPRNPLHSLH